MNRFLKMLMIVAAPVLLASPALAGPTFGPPEGAFNKRTPVPSSILDISNLPGTDKVMTTIMVVPNEHQLCVCGVVSGVAAVRCACETPKVGVCLEVES